MAPMEYLGAWGTLIQEKKLKSKISCQTPFNYVNHHNYILRDLKIQKENYCFDPKRQAAPQAPHKSHSGHI
jgi:hypothetical protein